MNDPRHRHLIQESQYSFPYHYLPRLEKKGFRQLISLKWGYEYLSYLNFTIERLGELDFRSLLDVGCGDGRLLFELSQTVTGKCLVGIDFSNRAIDFAKAMSPGLEWISGDITDREIFQEKFDVITLVETLEHIPPDEIENFVESLHHNLVDDGVLFLTVPSDNESVRKKHYQHFNLETLARTLKPFFKIENVFYLNRNSFLLKNIFRKILQNRYFLLNERHLLNMMYRLYLKYFLVAGENNCKRIALHSKKVKI